MVAGAGRAGRVGENARRVHGSAHGSWQAGLVRVDRGAAATLPERSIHVCVSGGGSIGAETVRRFTAVHVAAGETARIEAAAEMTLLRMILPDLSGLEFDGQVERAA